MLRYLGVAAGVFLIAAVPVFQNLAGQLAAARTNSQVTATDLARLLDLSNGPLDFFGPYLYVGAIPALVAFALIGTRRHVHPMEIGALASLLGLFIFWELFLYYGLFLTRIVPYVGLFKDFIKLEIVMGVPITIGSVLCLRWVATELMGDRHPLATGVLVSITLALVVVPQAIAIAPVIGTAQLGLSGNARVPEGYTTTLDRLHKLDPDTQAYRILWAPMDFRLFRSFETLQPNALLYRQDSALETRKAVLDTYAAIVNKQEGAIAHLLATEGVKYVVLDLADGQIPGDGWQTGQMQITSVYGTYLLTGSEAGYQAVFNGAQGMVLEQSMNGYLIYRNSYWRPMLSSYVGILRPNPGLFASLSSDVTSALDLRVAMGQELPDLLFEPISDATSYQDIESGALYSLAIGPAEITNRFQTIRLVSYSDVNLRGTWSTGDSATPLGLARFTEQRTGFIDLHPSVVAALPVGGRAIWIEYGLGSKAFGNGVVHQTPIVPGSPPVIACETSGCTIADILLVPPLPSEPKLTRFAEAYSSLLRSAGDGHRPPIAVKGDWASFYQASTDNFPSPVYDPQSWLRWLGLAFGYLVLIASLVIAFLPGFDRLQDGQTFASPIDGQQ
jgi:hypothetical protein